MHQMNVMQDVCKVALHKDITKIMPFQKLVKNVVLLLIVLNAQLALIYALIVILLIS